jgi:hypothetical protein
MAPTVRQRYGLITSYHSWSLPDGAYRIGRLVWTATAAIAPDRPTRFLGRIYRAPGRTKGWIVEQATGAQAVDPNRAEYILARPLAPSEEDALESLARVCGMEPLPGEGELPADLAGYEAHWVIGSGGYRYSALVHLEDRDGGQRRPTGPGLTATACGHPITPKPEAFRRGLAEHGGDGFVLCHICVQRAQAWGVPVPPWKVGRSRHENQHRDS